jgi:hypothetical protein
LRAAGTGAVAFHIGDQAGGGNALLCQPTARLESTQQRDDLGIKSFSRFRNWPI